MTILSTVYGSTSNTVYWELIVDYESQCYRPNQINIFNCSSIGNYHVYSTFEDPSDPLYDPTDKLDEYSRFPLNENNFDGGSTTEGKLSDPSERHKDKVLDDTVILTRFPYV